MSKHKQHIVFEPIFWTLIKVLLFLALMRIIIPVYPMLCQGVYKLINRIDSSIYTRYATNNKFAENVFFTNEVNEQFEILDQLNNEIVEFRSCTNIFQFAQAIITNQDAVSDIIKSNTDYCSYLESKNASIPDIMEWATATAQLNLNISTICLYLTFLTGAILFVVLFRNRKTFYTVAGIIYIFSMLSTFSHGLTDYIIPHILNYISNVFSSSSVFWSYDDILQYKFLFRQPYVESLLTFIIFDSVIQLFQNHHDKKREYATNYLSHFLSLQICYLSQYHHSATLYAMKIPDSTGSFGIIMNYCKKRKIICSLKLLLFFKFPTFYKNAETEKNDMSKLSSLLFDLTSSKPSTPCTTDDHLKKLHTIQSLMFKYRFI